MGFEGQNVVHHLIEGTDHHHHTYEGVGSFLGMTRVAVADADHAVLVDEELIAYTSITTSRTVTFPLANSVPAGSMLIAKDESGNCANPRKIQLRPSGSDTIEGIAGIDYVAAYTFAGFYSDGVSGWWRWS